MNQNLDDFDATSQAGWLYTDLLLGLMVVFLATISFIPAYVGNVDTQNTNSATAKVNILKKQVSSFVISISKGSSLDLSNAINQYLKKSNKPMNSRVTVFQVIGGYRASDQMASDGLSTAIDFSSKLRAANLSALSLANSSIGSSPDVPVGTVLVRLTFENA